MTRLNLLLLVGLLASCLYLVQISYQARRLFAELDRARSESRRLDAETQRLQAERQAQATHLRVEQMARDQLAMRNPTPAVTQYIADPASAARP